MKVSSADFIKNVEALTDRALSEAVTITRDGRARLVLVSADEYARLKRRDRIAARAEDISDEDLALVEAADMPDQLAAYDSEMKDRQR